jgi:hypothetical protein
MPPHPRNPGSDPTPTPWITGSATTEQLLAAAEHAVGDRYRIETIAGRGGSGRVFAARDTELGRPVAIKLLTLPPPHEADEPYASRASRAGEQLTAEARALAALDHPDLCRVVEVALNAPIPHLVMHWAKGEPLDRIAERKTVKARITLFLRVADAVAAMHEAGVVHGDLKPANILIDESGKPTIVDFGLARAESAAAPPSVGGSPGYAAPEQLLASSSDPTPLGPEADVFALGVILYELLTGENPFPPRTAPVVYAALLERGAIRLPQDIADDTPADLQKICLAAMERDPARRYADATALAADIRRYLKRETVAARPSLLTDKLRDEIETQIERTHEWFRLGMISRRDADNAARVLRALPHAESPWIVDARRLRGSQAALVAGGVLLVLATAVGLAATSLNTPIKATIAATAAMTPLVLGVYLHRSKQKRLGLGMLITATLAYPACAWMIAIDPELLAESPIEALGGTDPIIAATIAFPALLVAILARVVTRNTLFTWLALLIGIPTISLLIAAGVPDPRAVSLALIPASILTVPFALMLDKRSLTGSPSNGKDRHRRSDAPALLSCAMLTLTGALATLAVVSPGWTTADLTAEPTPARTAFAFLLNALLLTTAVYASTRHDTPINRRTAAVARWVLPTHLMLPLVFMDIHETFGVRTPWLIALGIASIAFTAASALHQWRPFLLAGLVFFAVWFVRTLDALPPAGDLALTLIALLTGLALMIAAWRAPALLAERRLRRWTRAADARPDPRSRRTWR